VNRAFTLIEALTVIGILAVLAAILFPVFSSAKNSSKGTSCNSNLHQLEIAIHLYSSDANDLMPYGPGPIAKVLSNQGVELSGDPYYMEMKTLPDLKSLLASYGTNEGIWKCPSDKMEPWFRPERAPSWYEEAKASYTYDDFDALSGVSLGQIENPSGKVILRDHSPFHGGGNESLGGGRFNVGFFDGHVASLVKPPQDSGFWF